MFTGDAECSPASKPSILRRVFTGDAERCFADRFDGQVPDVLQTRLLLEARSRRLTNRVRMFCRQISLERFRVLVSEFGDICITMKDVPGTRVSNELGAGHPRAARNAVLVVLFLAVTEGALVGLVLILLRNVWGYAYSNEVEVVRYAGAMIPILAISNFADGIECILSGIVRGCGWQKIGAFINLGSYYLVGMPSAVLLAFVLHIGGKVE